MPPGVIRCLTAINDSFINTGPLLQANAQHQLSRGLAGLHWGKISMEKNLVKHPVIAGKRAHKRQQGTSLILVLLVLTIAAFLGMFAFKVVPSHLEFLTVKSIGTSIASNDELMKQPKSKVMEALTRSFRANSLWELKAEEAFVISKDASRGGYKVEVDYEKRSTLFHNIDVVSKFQHNFSEDI